MGDKSSSVLRANTFICIWIHTGEKPYRTHLSFITSHRRETWQGKCVSQLTKNSHLCHSFSTDYLYTSLTPCEYLLAKMRKNMGHAHANKMYPDEAAVWSGYSLFAKKTLRFINNNSFYANRCNMLSDSRDALILNKSVHLRLGKKWKNRPLQIFFSYGSFGRGICVDWNYQ